jgi:hypothetical protein
MTLGTRLTPAHARGSHDRAAVAALVPAHNPQLSAGRR